MSIAHRVYRGFPRLVSAAVAVLLLSTFPAAVEAFTEPNEAPPGGTVAAPLNSSNTTQTKLGRLIVKGGLDVQDSDLSVGTSTVPKRICWNDECLGGWDEILALGAGGEVTLRTGATPNPPLGTAAPADFDQGYISVQATQVPSLQTWAVGGQAADSPNFGLRTGVLGMANNTTNYFSAGIYGLDNDTGAGSTALAGYFKGRVLITKNHSFNENEAPPSASLPNANDTLAIYTNTFAPSSGIYVEQENRYSFAGYFSGGDYGLGVSCDDDAMRCLTINATRAVGSGQFVWQKFDRNRSSGATSDQWWLFSDLGTDGTLDSNEGYLGLDYVTNDASFPIQSVPIYRFTRGGKLGFGSGNIPDSKFLVNAGVTSGDMNGNVNNAVDILANTSDTALYVQQQAGAAWTAYFSGPRTNIMGEICLNDPGDHSKCILDWPSGGPGANLWTETANVIHPVGPTKKVAIGGSNSDAPFYFDPVGALMAVNSGGLQVNSGALSVNRVITPPPQRCPPEGCPRRDGGDVSLKSATWLDAFIPPVEAGIITNPGLPPANRIYVKDGVIAIDNSMQSGGSKMEIGNAGRDIASSGPLYLRPEGIDYTIAAQISKDASGRASFRSPLGLFRIPINGSVLQVYNDQTGPTNNVATAGFFRNDKGDSVAPALVSENAGSGDAVQGKVLGAANDDSAIYGQNASTTGYASFFSGRAKIDSGALTPGLLVTNNSADKALEVTQSGTGLSAAFTGPVNITSTDAKSLRIGAVGTAKQICLYGTGAEDCKDSWPSLAGGSSKWNRTQFNLLWFLQPQTRSDNVWLGDTNPNAAAPNDILTISENAAVNSLSISNNMGNAINVYGGSILSTYNGTTKLDKNGLKITGSGTNKAALFVEHIGDGPGNTGEIAAEFRGKVQIYKSNGLWEEQGVDLGTTIDPVELCLHGDNQRVCRSTWPSSSTTSGSGTAGALPLWTGPFNTASSTLGNSIIGQFTDGASVTHAGVSSNVQFQSSLFEVASDTNPFNTGHTFVSNNSAWDPAAYNAITGVKRLNSGMTVYRGSAIYGELAAGSACANDAVCAAIYGSNATVSATSWAGYFSGGLLVEGNADPSASQPMQIRSNTRRFTASHPRGHWLQLGGAANSAGLNWRFYEAEGWPKSGIQASCIDENYSTFFASGGKAVRFSGCSPASASYGDTLTPITYTPLDVGEYKLIVRARTNNKTSTGRINIGYLLGINPPHGDLIIRATDFLENNTWQSFKAPFESIGANFTIKMDVTNLIPGGDEILVDSFIVAPDL